MPVRSFALLLCAALCACGPRSSQTLPETPSEETSLEGTRFEATRQEDGSFEVLATDAQSLFRRGVARMRDGQREEAAEDFDRVVRDFPESRFVSSALYNAGLCLKESAPEQAVERFEDLLERLPNSPDRKDSRFQLLELHYALEQQDAGVAQADALLELELTPDERMEAMAMRARLLLSAERREDAAHQARQALGWMRRQPDGERPRETYFSAAANYVLAETYRMRAEEISVPEGALQAQRAILEQRAQLMLMAQRTYFDTMRHTHPHWAAAAGYRIGAMYETFWEAFMSAPPPPPPRALEGEELEFFQQEYRRSLARLIKPLIRHSIRYWELTLVMIERTQVRTEWTMRIRNDLEAAEARLLEQPDDAVDEAEAQQAAQSAETISAAALSNREISAEAPLDEANAEEQEEETP